MQNYHRHSCYSNIFTADSSVTNEDYAKRAAELGHKIISSVEHGWQGYYFECFELAKKYNLKFVFGTEAYWVKDRHEKDKTNGHIIILAKNENGRQAINDILSTASEDGYYFKPRVDLELLLSLPSEDVFITSACIAFWQYDDIEEIIIKLHNHFKDNLMLEIQYHNTEKQIELNKKIRTLSNKYDVKMIVGLDSHYIYPEQSDEREYILESKGIHYENEDGWYMDYPDDKTVFLRFKAQNIFTDEEIQEAMDNTDVCLSFDDYDNVPIFNKEIKLLTLYPNLTQEKKDKLYSKLITKKFKEYMKNIPPEKYQEYYEGVKMEVQTYKDTGMVDYPLLDYEIVKEAIRLGGLITSTGRGCFTKDALVHTKQSLKTIDKVVIGDSVIDMYGNFKKVINTMSYGIQEDMIKISYLYGGSTEKYPNICTKDHLILVRRKDSIQWIEAQHLVKGDYVCLPKIHLIDNQKHIIDLNDYNIFGYKYDDNYIYEYSPFINNSYEFSPKELSRVFGVSKKTMQDLANGIKNDFKRKPGLLKQILQYTHFNSINEYRDYIQNMRTIKINRYINVDYELGQFVGLMYGDGCNCADRNEISLTINNISHKNIINRKIFESIAQTFGVKSYCKADRKKHLSKLGLRSKLISRFVSETLFISKLNSDKQFNEQLFDYPDDFKKGIVNGLFLSDGSYLDERKSFDNTSLSIINAYKLLQMNFENGIMGLSVRESGIDKRGYKHKESYKLRQAINPFNSYKTNECCLEDEKYWYLPIKSIELLPQVKTTVYDLTIEDSHSYLINNMVVHNSAVGYFTNTLCGFSKVDRFTSAIKLYPERFISTTRILETKSIPDVDLNVGTPEIFEQAQINVCGREHVYPMIAFGTFKKKNAFKMYAKAMNLEFSIANTISNQIDKYDKAITYAEDDEVEDISIYDYIDEKYHSYIDASKKYWGIISDKKKAPSAYLLYQGNIRKEIGLLKCKSESTKKEYITCVIDGAIAENYKFLKNDILKVDVVLLINKVFERIGIEPFDVNTLLRRTTNDTKVWELYWNGYTVGMNQVERKSKTHPNPFGTVNKVKKYKPKNISELSAFIAAIRPGFKSMYSRFESREDFKWGIPTLDNLIRTKELPVSFLFFQEQVMSVLNYAGFPMDECYGIIKAIAKKHPEKVKPLKDRFIKGFRKKLIENERLSIELAQSNSEKVWQIVNDNCGYSFNSAHAYSVALDSLYNAWQKANYPYEFYEVLLNHYTEKGNKEKVSWLKEEMFNAFKISEGEYKWGLDNRKFVLDKEHHCINPSLVSIKGIGQNVANILFEASHQGYQNLYDIFVNVNISSDIYQKLIKLGYFSDFGSTLKILKYKNAFDSLYERKQFNKDGIEPAYEKYIVSNSKETSNQYTNFDSKKALLEIWDSLGEEDISIIDKITNEIECLGYAKTIIPDISPSYCYVQSIKGNQKRTIKLYRLYDGTTEILRVKEKDYNKHPFKEGQLLKTIDCYNDKKWKLDKEKSTADKKAFYQIDETERILSKWSIVEDD